MDRSGLFVDDDEAMEDAVLTEPSRLSSQTASGFALQNSDEDDEIEDEDPIVETIPLIMNDISGPNQHLYVLLYPGKPKSSFAGEPELATALKPKSKYLEVKVPLATDKFYDENRAEEWGVQVTEQALQGVLDRPRGGLCVGKIRVVDGQRQVVIIPVNGTTQLRPSFKYVDAAETARNNQRKVDMDFLPKQTSSHVLQTSARSGPQPDGFAGTLVGESLKHIRQFEEEEWGQLHYHGPQEATSASLAQQLIGDADSLPLSTTTDMAGYIHQLTNVQ